MSVLCYLEIYFEIVAALHSNLNLSYVAVLFTRTDRNCAENCANGKEGNNLNEPLLNSIAILNAPFQTNVKRVKFSRHHNHIWVDSKALILKWSKLSELDGRPLRPRTAA